MEEVGSGHVEISRKLDGALQEEIQPIHSVGQRRGTCRHVALRSLLWHSYQATLYFIFIKITKQNTVLS